MTGRSATTCEMERARSLTRRTFVPLANVTQQRLYIRPIEGGLAVTMAIVPRKISSRHLERMVRGALLAIDRERFVVDDSHVHTIED